MIEERSEDKKAEIRRFFMQRRDGGSSESIGGLARLDATRIDRIVGELAAAKAKDPLTFGGVVNHPDTLRANIVGAMEALNSDGENANLSIIQMNSLESIILLVGRPPIYVLNDDFDVPEGEWEVLSPFRPSISRTLRSVGRIATGPNEISAPYLGTGFVVAPGVVMTNRHVLTDQGLATKIDGRWAIAPGCTLRIDFKQEYGNSAKAEFKLSELLWLDDREEVDLALLRIDTGDGRTPPPPLGVQRESGFVGDDNMIYAVGYPASDHRADAVQSFNIFEGTYEKKRLSPGRIMDVDEETFSFKHDCTTLAGSSGSCIVDLTTSTVIGLHFKGDYREFNSALHLPLVPHDKSWNLNLIKGRHD